MKQAKERVAIYGASNAAGWAESHLGVDYHSANIMQAAIKKPPFVQESPSDLVIDLSTNPQLPEGEFVLNVAIPGADVFELMENFEFEVLDAQPSHLFFWSGLNDIVVAVTLLHDRGAEDRLAQEGYEEGVKQFKDAFTRLDDIDSSLTAASGIIFSQIEHMVTSARNNQIQTLIGTIPPFSAALPRWEEDPTTPDVKHFRKEGLALIGLVNNRIRVLGRDDCTIDAFSRVVDQETGLTKAGFSYGVTVPDFGGDILHLNSMGQIQVAQVLCQRVLNKNVAIVPPNPARIRQG